MDDFRTRYVAAIATLLFCIGCQSAPQAYNVKIRLSDSVRNESGAFPGVDVFLRGISDWELSDWEKLPNVDKYARYQGVLDPNGPERVLKLGADEPIEKTMPRDNPAWPFWAERKATHLIIIANFPRSKPDQPGRDRRLLILPLARRLYSSDTIEVNVTRDGLDLKTPPAAASH